MSSPRSPITLTNEQPADTVEPGLGCRLLSSRRLGKAVQIRCGPAAVTGDERYIIHCGQSARGKGVAIRRIRKPEDLPKEGQRRSVLPGRGEDVPGRRNLQFAPKARKTEDTLRSFARFSALATLLR